MSKKEKQVLQGREELRKYFRNGKVPTEQHFDYLIDSMANKLDDGFSKSDEDGMMLSPTGSSRRMLSFLRHIDDRNPSWVVGHSGANEDDLNITDRQDDPRLYLRRGGRVGINTSEPDFALQVEGYAASRGRLGVYAKGSVPANRRWHDLAIQLNGCQAFEVVARVGGPSGSGRYALLHAVALNCFGKSRIRRTRAQFGWFWNRINLRWEGGTYDFRLQIRTQRNYGEDARIRYHVTNLWDDSLLEHDSFADPQDA